MAFLSLALSLVLSLAAARPWIGIALGKGDKGVKVTEVLEGPAQKAGVLVGDQVLAVGQMPVRTPEQLIEVVVGKGVGVPLELHVLRDGKQQRLTLTTEARPDLEEQRRRQFVNKVAPELELATSLGQYPAQLTKLKGQVVLLDFWATWCGPCIASAPHLNALYAELAPRGLKVIGVTSDDWKKVQSMTKRLGLHYTVAHDPEDKVALRYGIVAMPTYVLIGRDGRVLRWWSGRIDASEIQKALQ